MDDLSSYRRSSRGWQNDACAFIHPRIFFGPGIEIDQEFIDKHDVKLVVNCAFDVDCPKWYRQRYPDRYICLNAPDDLNENILNWYPSFEKAVTGFFHKHKEGKVFVHCQCGINRSGFLSLLYACKKLGYSFQDAMHNILKQRPCALTNPSYKTQVFEYCILRSVSEK